MKKIKRSSRGLTFSINDESKIGSKFRYFINPKKSEILIVEDENGTGTVSRKKSGKSYKALYDIRTKEVRNLVSSSTYMEVEETDDNIIIHIYKEIKSNISRFTSNIIRIEDLFLQKEGEIVLSRAVGCGNFFYNVPSLSDNGYFHYLEHTISSRGGDFKKEKRKIQQVYDVVSLFSGAGLLDYAFNKDPQFRFVFGIDFDANACETYKYNIGNHIVCDDIRNINSKNVPDCDVITGGVCCQGYSNANRQDINKQSALNKRLLIDDYVRIVKDKNPEVFVIENVPQLLTKDDGLYIDKVFNGLSDYEITCKVVCDSDVGGYSYRKRAIVIGSRIGKISLPDATIHTVKTVKDALSKVDSTWFNYSDVTMPRPNTETCMSYVPQGGNWKDIPESIHKFGNATQSNIYRRLSWDEPSPTITNWRKCNLMHPDENRILNVSEACAIMGLPKDFHILGKTLNAKQQQVGNGVTQAIGTFVKKYVLNALNKYHQIIPIVCAQ